MSSIPLTKAVSLHLGNRQQPVVTRYDLATILCRLYRAKKFEGKNIKIPKDTPELDDFSELKTRLLDQGTLTPDRDFPKNLVFRILGKQDAPAEDIACTVDPFAFVSHLSAMDYHGLTDRLPRSLYLSSPPEKTWEQLALERTEKEHGGYFPDYVNKGFPKLRRIRVAKVGDRPIKYRGASDIAGAYRNVYGRVFRVATIGRTFLDMVREPALCGGINHVLDVFKEHAESYLNLIIDEVENRGHDIDKVRAGYILEDRCSIDRKHTGQWLKHVQRGGSRKLDPKAEYSPKYSARWSLSINVIES